MAITKMHHFKLYTMKSTTEDVLSFFQDFGKVHLKDLSSNGELLDIGLDYVSEPSEVVNIREEIEEIEKTIEILEKYTCKKGAVEKLKEGKDEYSFDEVMKKGSRIDVSEILKLTASKKEEMNVLFEDIQDLKSKICEMKPWTNLKLSSKDLRSTAKVDYILGEIDAKDTDDFLNDLKALNYTHGEKVSTDDKKTYMLIISLKEERSALDTIFNKYMFVQSNILFDEVPALEIEKRNKKIEEDKAKIKEIEDVLSENTKSLPDMELRYDYLTQISKKMESTNKLLSTKYVNLIEGYIESKDVSRFEDGLEKNFGGEFFLEINPADDNDADVPILLSNNKIVSSFESLTEMYGLPKYNELDPTPLLAPFYWLFFGMMIGDLGYGLIMVIGTGIFLRFNLSESKRKSIRFFYYLGYAAILWGLIYGSLFGGLIPIPGLIDPASDYIAVMAISIALGGLHMFLGLGIQGYLLIKNQSVLDAVYDVLTWYMTLFGAIYMMLGNVLSLPGVSVAKYIMIIGMIGVVVFTGRDAKNPFVRLASGAYNLYGISSWLGDFISYLRLMALGLSGAFIGVAVNMIASTISSSGIVGIIIAIIVLLFGHILNFGLSLLSAYVHDLRLTFVEFFGKFYNADGVAFEGVREEPKYIEIRNKED